MWYSNLQTVLNWFQTWSEKQNLNFVTMSVIVFPALKYSMKSAEDDSNYLCDLSAT